MHIHTLYTHKLKYESGDDSTLFVDFCSFRLALASYLHQVNMFCLRQINLDL